jgi:hypothetical protein
MAVSRREDHEKKKEIERRLRISPFFFYSLRSSLHYSVERRRTSGVCTCVVDSEVTPRHVVSKLLPFSHLAARFFDSSWGILFGPVVHFHGFSLHLQRLFDQMPIETSSSFVLCSSHQQYQQQPTIERSPSRRT